VFKQPEASIAKFLRHLWSTDGCIHLSHGKNHYTNVYYGTSSMGLACNVQSLLLRLGINATLSQHAQGNKGRDQYHIKVSGKPDIELFLKLVGGLGQNKTIHQKAMIEHLTQRIAKTNRDVIPYGVWEYLGIPAKKTMALASDKIATTIANEVLTTKVTAYLKPNEYKQNLSRERAIRVASMIQSEQLAMLAQSDVYWDEVTFIESAGEAEVYDLTVDVHHNFIASEIIVNNSIEQDADIVMFIYRDDVYNPDSERKNIADIIVAKHRNGPVGEVSLYFQASQTRFRDLEVSPPVEE
jgi:replicative DNA helicase